MIAAVFDPCIPSQDVEYTAARHQQEVQYDVLHGMSVLYRSPSIPSNHANSSAADVMPVCC